MNYDNVKLWFAHNNGNIVTIDEINEENKNENYSCPVCGSELKPKAIKSKQVSSHFAHIDSSKCNSETMIHWWFKHKFLEVGDAFTVTSDEERQYVVKEVKVEQSYQVTDNTYKPDVTIFTDCGKVIYFEMAFSNKKNVKDYLDIWLELKNIVVEIDIKQLMFKSEIPAFKALFYEGKCFNIKKNDKYYNTIGRYKEEKLKGKFDSELKERIRKLDWFWNDVLKYKKGDFEIEYMIELIDSIDKEDKSVIIEVLKKQKCLTIYEEYVKVKLEKYYNEITHYFDEFYPYEFYSISKIDIGYGKILLEPQIKLSIKDSMYHYVYEINEFTIGQIKNKISKNINDVVINMKNKSTLEFAKRNEILKSAISDVDLKYKEVDNLYHFYDRFTYDRFVNLSYNYHTLIDFMLPEEIIYSDDRVKIYEYIVNKIEKYMVTVEPFDNLNFIEDTLNKISEKYNNTIIGKEEVTNRVRVGKGRYKNKKEIKDIFVKVSHKPIAQDIIKVSFERNFIGSRINEYLFIYKDKLYSYYSDYKLLERIKSGELQLMKDIKAFDDLEDYVIEYINLQIKRDLNRNCINCDSKIEMTTGEIKFFIDKGLLLPKRCKTCRVKRKQNN